MKIKLAVVFASLLSFVNIVLGVDVKIQLLPTISWVSSPTNFYQVWGRTNFSSGTNGWELVEDGIIGTGDTIQRTYSGKPLAFFKVEQVTTPDLSGKLLFQNDFSSRNLTSGKFTTANILFASFTNATLEKASFVGTTMDGVDFSGADAFGADFKESPYIAADFTNTNLGNTNFEDSRVFNSSFRNANLKNVSFARATLEFCDFTGAKDLNPNGGRFVLCVMTDGTFRNDP